LVARVGGGTAQTAICRKRKVGKNEAKARRGTGGGDYRNESGRASQLSTHLGCRRGKGRREKVRYRPMARGLKEKKNQEKETTLVGVKTSAPKLIHVEGSHKALQKKHAPNPT